MSKTNGIKRKGFYLIASCLLLSGTAFAGQLNLAKLKAAVPNANDREKLIEACVANPDCELVYNNTVAPPNDDDVIDGVSTTGLVEMSRVVDYKLIRKARR